MPSITARILIFSGPNSSCWRCWMRSFSSLVRWVYRSCIVCRSRCLVCFAAGDRAIDCWSNARTAESSCCCSFWSSSRPPWISRWSVESAVAYPGVCCVIWRELTYPIFTGAGAVPVAGRAGAGVWAAAGTTPTSARHTTTARVIVVSEKGGIRRNCPV